MRDVLVAGAGPAGLAVALGAARAGLDVAVCDRRTGELDKACGEGLMPVAVRQLEHLGISPAGASIRGISYLDGHRQVSADFRSGPGRGVRRLELHRTMLAAVDAAGIPILHGGVSRVRQDEHRVTTDFGDARYLVAADGLHSPIRRLLDLEKSVRGRRRWGQRRHYAGGLSFWGDSSGGVGRHVEVHWAARSEAYLTPVGGGVFGVAILSSVQEPYDQQLRAFPLLHERLGAADPVSEVRGAGPLRHRTRRRVAGRVLLVGDAAGYVDALTGEGIGVALSCARSLVACLAADRPNDYERIWARVSRPSRALTAGLLTARRSPYVAAHVVQAAQKFPRVFDSGVQLLAG